MLMLGGIIQIFYEDYNNIEINYPDFKEYD